MPASNDSMNIERTKKPSTLRSIWEWWQRFAKKIGDIQARILLTLFYFVIFGPFALAMRWKSDPMAIKTGAPRGWRTEGDRENNPMEQARKQF